MAISVMSLGSRLWNRQFRGRFSQSNNMHPQKKLPKTKPKPKPKKLKIESFTNLCEEQGYSLIKNLYYTLWMSFNLYYVHTARSGY